MYVDDVSVVVGWGLLEPLHDSTRNQEKRTVTTTCQGNQLPIVRRGWTRTPQSQSFIAPHFDPSDWSSHDDLPAIHSFCHPDSVIRSNFAFASVLKVSSESQTTFKWSDILHIA
jgi:hypothetical protein